MLTGMLLHVVAATFGVDHAANPRSRRNNLTQLMPDLALLVFENVFNSSFERDAGLRLCDDGAGIERLSTARRIKRRAVELHRPTRLIAIAAEFLNVQYVRVEVEE